MTTLALALRRVSPDEFAKFWDDALFFRRVAYNLLHHGFAGWNRSDGPVFVNTSQLFQLLSTLVLALFPGHYNAAVVGVGAIASTMSFVLIWRAAGAGRVAALLLFCLMQAPPVFLAIVTGMETPLVILVIAFTAFAIATRCRPGVPLAPWIALQLFVYLARPDALLLSFVATAACVGDGRRLLRFGLGTLVLLLFASAGFYAYYGSPLPLATFLKLAPFSVYDAHYLSLGIPDKLKNLAQLALLGLPLAPLWVARLDRVNRALLSGSAVFVLFHALTTTEIAGYHARFYAPAFPFLFVAALRGLADLTSATARRRLIGVGVLAAALVVVAFMRGTIENADGYGPDIVDAPTYALYFLGVPLAAFLLGRPHARQALELSVVTGVMAAYQVARLMPDPIGVVSDAVSDLKTVDSHMGDVGIDVIKRCFPEPIQLMHSEIGLPSVLFPESHVYDFTGLSDPRVLRGTFDFERICRENRPEFVFRPHWTHERLNRNLDASVCLAQNYQLAPLPRASSCPLLVRNDLFARYVACAK